MMTALSVLKMKGQHLILSQIMKFQYDIGIYKGSFIIYCPEYKVFFLIDLKKYCIHILLEIVFQKLHFLMAFLLPLPGLIGLFLIQSEICQSISQKLSITITWAQLRGVKTSFECLKVPR